MANPRYSRLPVGATMLARRLERRPSEVFSLITRAELA
jgi:hypothetical protein